MNNRIAINMIKSYSCLTQTPNNIYLGSILIPKVEGVCDSDLNKYLVDKKDGKLNKGIFDIQVIDVYLTSVYSNP